MTRFFGDQLVLLAKMTRRLFLCEKRKKMFLAA